MKTATQGIWHLEMDEPDLITIYNENNYIEVTNDPEGLKWFYTGTTISDWRDLPASVLELISLWFTTKKVDEES